MKYMVINLSLYRISNKDYEKIEAIDMHDDDAKDIELDKIEAKYKPIQNHIDVYNTA